MTSFTNTKVYVINNVDSVESSSLEFLYAILPDERKTVVNNCYWDHDKTIKIVEYFVLQKILAQVGGGAYLNRVLNFKYTKNGKPYISYAPCFNISHSKTKLVIAVSVNQVGVDIEPIIKFRKRLARYICTPQEYQTIVKSDNKDLELTKLWTKKESFIKLKGLAFANNLKTILNNASDCKFKFWVTGEDVTCLCEQV